MHKTQQQLDRQHRELNGSDALLSLSVALNDVE